ncbi:PilN domain-containing protein [Vibrio eleionomae]
MANEVMIKFEDWKNKFKFSFRTEKKPPIYAVVQPSALYFSSHANVSLPERYPLDEKEVAPTLVNALMTAGVKGATVDVILHSRLYQSYQIDKPAIPASEWPSALPFLLKDLIRDKVTEVVADAHELPDKSKVQSYVMSKKLVLELSAQLETIDCELGRIIPEQEVWALSGGETANFLLLQKSAGGDFKLEAFFKQQCIFQRTLRGITSPITGRSASVLQLDGLALELQRSVDYLSSQMKGMPLHLLKVCCDEEDNEEVVKALNERLSVKSSLLNSETEWAGQVLALAVDRLSVDSINLYQDHLKPEKNYFTLANVGIGWAAIASVFLCIFAFEYFHGVSLQKELKITQQTETQLKSERDTLKKEAVSHQPSPEKLAAISRLKKEIESKKASIGAVDTIEKSKQIGYSGVMAGLAKLSNKNISLSEIEIDNNQLNIKGFARNAEAVPAWIAEFKQELHLVGRAFEKMQIARNEKGIVTFELRTKHKQESK